MLSLSLENVLQLSLRLTHFKVEIQELVQLFTLGCNHPSQFDFTIQDRTDLFEVCLDFNTDDTDTEFSLIAETVDIEDNLSCRLGVKGSKV